MLLDKPKEELAQEMLAQAAAAWGGERAKELTPEINTVAGWMSLIGSIQIDQEADEPDFVAPLPPVLGVR